MPSVTPGRQAFLPSFLEQTRWQQMIQPGKGDSPTPSRTHSHVTRSRPAEEGDEGDCTDKAGGPRLSPWSWVCLWCKGQSPAIVEPSNTKSLGPAPRWPRPQVGEGCFPFHTICLLLADRPKYLTLVFTSRSFGQMCFPLRVVGKILLQASYRTLVLLGPGLKAFVLLFFPFHGFDVISLGAIL